MIQFSQVAKLQGGKPLYLDANFQINPGEKVGIVGPNGAGKTTLFRLLVKEESPDEGQVSIPNRITIGYFSQDVGEMKGRSVLQETLLGVAVVAELAQKISEAEAQMSEPMELEELEKLLERYGEWQSHFQAAGGYDLEVRAKEILGGLGFTPGDFERQVEHFSGGWKMRIALAKMLLLQPDVLLLDEPTNHLDLESIMWLEQWLVGFKGMVLLTSHDRTFMNKIVNKILEIYRGSVTLYSGNYDYYEKERDIRKQQLIASQERQQAMLAKEEEFIARFAARASHAAQVQSRVKKLEKIDRIEVPKEDKVVKFQFNKPPRSGDEVSRFRDLSKTWTSADGKELQVFRNASATIRRLDKVALVGVNGAGKSTLLKIITQNTPPTHGNMEMGASVVMGYFSQHAMDVLNPEHSILEHLQGLLPSANVGTLKTLLGAFLFSDDESSKKIKVLSGGEKSRVVLAGILARPVNFIVLDEPTNHLDIKSREILMDALVDFEGTLIVVSHDRYFLQKITNRTFKLDQGNLEIYEGGFEEYLNSAQGDILAR
jgi:ATP-binding cassette subfamily F protein 3